VGPHHVVQITLTLWFAETAVKRRKTILKRMHLKVFSYQEGHYGLTDRTNLLPDQATFVRLVIQTTDSHGMRCGRRKPCGLPSCKINKFASLASLFIKHRRLQQRRGA
jgi:hypothetical protein